MLNIFPEIFLQAFNSQTITITLIIIVITAVTSIAALNNPSLMHRFNLNPYMIVHRNQWYRVLTHGFIHADWIHLFVNMFVFFSFGRAVETYLKVAEYEGFISNPALHFLSVYFLGMFISTVATVEINTKTIIIITRWELPELFRQSFSPASSLIQPAHFYYLL